VGPRNSEPDYQWIPFFGFVGKPLLAIGAELIERGQIPRAKNSWVPLGVRVSFANITETAQTSIKKT
jgi:hypothetical protein